MRIRYSPAAVQNGALPLWVSDTVTKELGAQRVIPQPAQSALENNGISYSFPATAIGSIEFALQPTAPGLHQLKLRVAGRPEMEIGIFVMP